MKYLLALLCALLGSLSLVEARATSAQAPVDSGPAIRYLIDVVARSDYTFVRNSTHYSAVDAAQHLQRKYDHFRDKIHTVDDFIELAASRSLLTGKPYLVIDSKGTSRPTAEWLRQVLSEYCTGRAAGTLTAPAASTTAQCAE